VIQLIGVEEKKCFFKKDSDQGQLIGLYKQAGGSL
jgi:hypothetical protein